MKSIIRLLAAPLVFFATPVFAQSIRCVGTSFTHDIAITITPLSEDPSLSRFEYFFGHQERAEAPLRFSDLGPSLKEGRGAWTLDSKISGMHFLEFHVDGGNGLIMHSMAGEPIENVGLNCY